MGSHAGLLATVFIFLRSCNSSLFVVIFRHIIIDNTAFWRHYHDYASLLIRLSMLNWDKSNVINKIDTASRVELLQAEQG